MLPVERLNRIKKIISEQKRIDVITLSQLLNVTEVTIRRDLEKLENENFLKRTHGGAVLNDSTIAASTLFDVNEEDESVYKSISKISSKFVANNELVFMGPGIASRYIVRAFEDKVNLTVVTTDLLVAHDCAQYCPQVKIFLPGGELNPSNLQLSGRITDTGLKSFYFDCAFFDIDGITLERGYSASSLIKSYIIQDVSTISKQSFAVCTSNHFDTESAAVIGNINMFDSIISNENAPQKFKEYYFNNNKRFYATFDAFRS
jgi:DeoR/GlpR family transcriptional regulator of sugar metabolism